MWSMDAIICIADICARLLSTDCTLLPRSITQSMLWMIRDNSSICNKPAPNSASNTYLMAHWCGQWMLLYVLLISVRDYSVLTAPCCPVTSHYQCCEWSETIHIQVTNQPPNSVSNTYSMAHWCGQWMLLYVSPISVRDYSVLTAPCCPITSRHQCWEWLETIHLYGTNQPLILRQILT